MRPYYSRWYEIIRHEQHLHKFQGMTTWIFNTSSWSSECYGFSITALSGAMATSRQIRRWIFVSRSRTGIRVFLSCLVCSFTLVYFVTFSDNFENGSNWENKNLILSHQVKQRNLKSATFLAQISNDQSYQLKPNDSRSPLYVNKKFRDLCPFVSPLLGKRRIISIVHPLNELTYQLRW
jgi:hypothetical protein